MGRLVVRALPLILTVDNLYRYEGVVEGNHAHGKYTYMKRINYLSLISGKWEASW